MERSGNSTSKIKTLFKEYKKEILLYFLLFFGGLWHILGIFQSIMDFTAQFMIILIAIFTYLEYFNLNNQTKVLSYSIIIIMLGFLIELIGHDTGFIFGEYKYQEVLNLKLGGVPIAIGFAWLSMILSSFALLQRTKLYELIAHKPIIKAIWIGIFMTIFDLFMEPAAVKLNYWTWDIGIVPLLNYFAWFVFGSIFAFVGVKMKIFSSLAPRFAMHVYLAQLLYFIMVYFS